MSAAFDVGPGVHPLGDRLLRAHLRAHRLRRGAPRRSLRPRPRVHGGALDLRRRLRGLSRRVVLRSPARRPGAAGRGRRSHLRHRARADHAGAAARASRLRARPPRARHGRGADAGAHRSAGALVERVRLARGVPLSRAARPRGGPVSRCSWACPAAGAWARGVCRRARNGCAPACWAPCSCPRSRTGRSSPSGCSCPTISWACSASPPRARAPLHADAARHRRHVAAGRAASPTARARGCP